MLIAYVSDERYVALPAVLLELEGEAASFEARSRATGAVHVEVPSGNYKVTIQKPGFGAKSVHLQINEGREPYQLRLLADGLLGYAWPKCLKVGEKSEFRVHSVEPYHLSLWRYGIRKQLIREIGWFDEHGPRATMQITPDGDYTQTGVQWNKHGYANPLLHQYVTAPERSGLYYFHARTKSGSKFSFPWIVAPSRPREPVAVLASNITWNAYNNFGGRSNYINPDRLPTRPTVNARLELKRYTDPENVTYDTEDYAPLSFDRPEPINHIDAQTEINDPIEGRAACHIAPAEWRLLGWLEREYFAYDYYAETQLHDESLDLDAYKVLILSTHPEYWTRTMYDRVKSWVNERGGRLMYLGGNGLNCEAELSGDVAIYRNGDAGALKRGGFESRFHMRVESEAALLGVVFTETGIMTGIPTGCATPRTGHLPAPDSAPATCSARRACTADVRAGPQGMRLTRSRRVRRRACSAWPKAQTSTTAAPSFPTTRPRAAARSSLRDRSPGPAPFWWTIACRRSRRMCCGGF